MPSWVPESTTTLAVLLMLCSIVQSTVSSAPVQSLLFDLAVLIVCLDWWLRWLDAEWPQYLAFVHRLFQLECCNHRPEYWFCFHWRLLRASCLRCHNRPLGTPFSYLLGIGDHFGRGYPTRRCTKHCHVRYRADCPRLWKRTLRYRSGSVSL